MTDSLILLFFVFFWVLDSLCTAALLKENNCRTDHLEFPATFIFALNCRPSNAFLTCEVHVEGCLESRSSIARRWYYQNFCCLLILLCFLYQGHRFKSNDDQREPDCNIYQLAVYRQKLLYGSTISPNNYFDKIIHKIDLQHKLPNINLYWFSNSPEMVFLDF